MLNSRNWFYAAIVAAGAFAGGLTAMQFAPGEALAARHRKRGQRPRRVSRRPRRKLVAGFL